MSLRFMLNLKENLRAPVLKSDGAAVVGGLLPMVIGTALNLEGWTGWGVSYGSVYLLAKGMGHENVARGAAAVAVTHLAWTIGAPYVQQIFGHGPWRMGAAQGVSNSVTQMSEGYDHMMDEVIPAGASVAQLPAGVKTYPSGELKNSVAHMSNSVAHMSNSVTQMSNSVTQMSGLRGGRNMPKISR